jgi:hypothetical protein
MTFEEYVVESNHTFIVHGGNWRTGQAYFNVLWDNRPDLSERVRATVLDPFHDDTVIPYFLAFVAKNW